MWQEQVFHLRTFTPLWLGDLERSTPQEKESGLIGSLRFWYEGLAREHHKQVCAGGTGQGRCEYGKNKSPNDLCEVCRLFGTTGWARRFRMELEGLEPVPVFFRASPEVAGASGNWLWRIFGGEDTGGSRQRLPSGDRRFQFGVKALWARDTFRIRVIPRVGHETDLARVAMTLSTAASRGGIGAKTQYGFGQVGLISDDAVKQLNARGLEALRHNPRPQPIPNDGRLNLSEERFFSLLYQFPNNPLPQAVNIGDPPTDFKDPYIPCSYDIRYKYAMKNPLTNRGTDLGLRPAVRDRYGSERTRELMGYVDDSRHSRGTEENARASRIHVSHLFRVTDKSPYFLKIWGDDREAKQVKAVVDRHIKDRFPTVKGGLP